MLRPNFLKNKLLKKNRVLGTWCTLAHPTTVEVIASSGLDFIIFDREHGPISFETITSLIAICESYQISPLVRVAEPHLSEIQRALDAGAHGLHVPNITTIQQLEQIIHLAKYPPLGNRGFSPFTRAAQFNHEHATKQFKQANHNTLLAIHIEGEQAIGNIDPFLSYPELDILFIGLFDLSKSFGVPGEITHPKVTAAMNAIVEKVIKSGKTIGTIATTLQQMEALLSWNIPYITYSADCDLLLHAYTVKVEHFRQINTKEQLCNSI